MSSYNLDEAIEGIYDTLRGNTEDEAFTVETEFGKIGIEILSGDYDPLYPVEVAPWYKAPPTKWCMRYPNLDCDYYVSVGNNIVVSEHAVYSYSVEIMMRVVLFQTLRYAVSQDIVDAVVKLYYSFYNKKCSINMMESVFSDVNLNVITRKDPMVREIVRELIIHRDKDADKIIAGAREIINNHGYHLINSFANNFYRDLFGVMLYAVKRDSTEDDVKMIHNTIYTRCNRVSNGCEAAYMEV